MVNSVACYQLEGAENSKIIISHDELKALFNQIESDFCQSDVYQKAFDGLQKRLGNAPKWTDYLIKAVGREAIRLALRQVVSQYRSTQTVAQDSMPIPPQNGSSLVVNEAGQRSESDSAKSQFETLSNHDTHPSSSQSEDDKHSQNERHYLSIQSKQPVAKPSTSSIPPMSSSEPNSSSISDGVKHHLQTPEKILLNQLPSPHLSLNNKTSSSTESQDIQPSSQKAPVKTAQQIALSSAQSQMITTPHDSNCALSNIQEKNLHVFQEIGTRLKKARLEKSLTIHEIHEKTHIGMHQITALEDGNLASLPEEVYVKGFIRQIARVLELDYENLIQLFPQSTSKPMFQPRKISSRKLRPISAPQKHSMRPAHLYIGYTALMASAVGGLVWANHGQTASNPDSIDLPIDIPEIIDNLTSILSFNENVQHPFHNQTNDEPLRTGAIAYPETVTVESSISGQYGDRQ